MQILPIDLTALVAVILGISIVLVPVIGITARFALKPIVDAMGRGLAHKGIEETVQILERRMALLEQQMESMDGSIRRLTEVSEFDRALEAGSRASSSDRKP